METADNRLPSGSPDATEVESHVETPIETVAPTASIVVIWDGVVTTDLSRYGNLYFDSDVVTDAI